MKKNIYLGLFVAILISLTLIYSAYGTLDITINAPTNNTGIGFVTSVLYNISSDVNGDVYVGNNDSLTCGEGTLMNKTAIPSGVTSFSPLFYYEFEGNTSDSGLFNNTLNGTFQQFTTGVVGQSIDIERSTDDYLFNNSFTLETNLSDIRTISFWVRPESLNINSRFICISDGTATNLMTIMMRQSFNLGMEWYQSGETNLLNHNGFYPFNVNNWYHIVLTFGDGDVKLYMNGTTTPALTFAGENRTFTSAYNRIWLGNYCGGDPTFEFDGRIDNVVAFDYVFNSSDIIEDFNSGNGRNYSESTVSDFDYEYTYTETGLTLNTTYDRYFSANDSLSCNADTENVRFATCPNEFYNQSTGLCDFPEPDAFAITLNDPLNNSLLFSSTINFGFTVNGSMDSCALYHNGSFVDNITSPSFGNNTFFGVPVANDTDIEWNVNCSPMITETGGSFFVKSQYAIPVITGFSYTSCDRSIGNVLLLALFFFMGLAIVLLGFMFDIPALAFFGGLIWLSFTYIAFPCYGSFVGVFGFIAIIVMFYAGVKAVS